MKQNFKLPQGYVEFQIGDKDPFTIKNAVLPNAKELMARALGGDTNYLINAIEVYDGATLVSTEEIVPTFPEIGTVKFSALIPADQAVGNIDKLVLKNTTHGAYSELTGFIITKPEQVLSIGWKLISE